MTIQIPDDLARGLEGIATAQMKTIEQVAVENLRLLVNPRSPAEILRIIRELRHPSRAAVDDLDAAIMAARLPIAEHGAFDVRAPE